MPPWIVLPGQNWGIASGAQWRTRVRASGDIF